MKKSRSAFFAIYFSLAAFFAAQGQNTGVVSGKTILHSDGTRTESVSDPNTREMEQKTFDANNVLILRRHYRLNERGQPVMGNIYDGSGNLVARSQSFFDAYGRLQEERLSNLQGEVYQQVIHEYDDKGEAKKPKVINYKVSSPAMRPALMDFTQQQPGMAAPATSGEGRVKAPVNLDAQQAQTGSAAATKPATEEDEPKKGFLQRLFKKKDAK